MAEGKMGIVIVNYNGANYQNDALRSIYASSYTNFEVIIAEKCIGTGENPAILETLKQIRGNMTKRKL